MSVAAPGPGQVRNERPIARFGVCEADARSGELRRNGVKVHLPEQAFQILLLLLERAPELVSREQIIQRLWPDGTVVEYERSIATAVSKLRDALRDSADSPRFVENVPRRGYRFIAPVQWVEPLTAPPAVDSPVAPTQAPSSTPQRQAGLRYKLLVPAAVIVAAIIIAYLLFRPATPLTFDRITFRRGTVLRARFTADGQTVVYGAAWNGEASRLFSTRTASPESAALAWSDADILAVSRTDQLAILLHPRFMAGPGLNRTGTLATVALDGGTPKEIIDQVQEADWNPDGGSLAIIHAVAGTNTVEYPIGTPQFRTAGHISNLRFSPSGDALAFFHHPVFLDSRAAIEIIDLKHHKATQLTREWNSAQGLAWSPDGREIWFTASDRGPRALYSIRRAGGSEKLIAHEPGNLNLLDISRQGHALVTEANLRMQTVVVTPGTSEPREFTWQDYSASTDISDDGRMLLFTEYGDAGGKDHAVFVRMLDGSPPLRLGDGVASALSPDAQWAISKLPSAPPERLVLLPTGMGQPKPLPITSLAFYHWASWFPDGKRLLVLANEAGRGRRLYIQELGSGKIRAISPEGVRYNWHAIAPDGRWAAALDPQNHITLYAVDGSISRVLDATDTNLQPIRFSGDGRVLYCYRAGELPTNIYQVDVATGHQRLWKTLSLADPAGVVGIFWMQLTPDARSYFYIYYRDLTDVYVGHR